MTRQSSFAVLFALAVAACASEDVGPVGGPGQPEPGHAFEPGPRRLRFYSDHVSDAPSFALADECYAVGRGGKLARHARAQGQLM